MTLVTDTPPEIALTATPFPFVSAPFQDERATVSSVSLVGATPNPMPEVRYFMLEPAQADPCEALFDRLACDEGLGRTNSEGHGRG